MATVDMNQRRTRIFGGKRNFLLRAQGKITKEEFRDMRLLPLSSIGEALARGNRKFKLVDGNILFCPARNEKHVLVLPKLRKNLATQLSMLEFATEQKRLPVSYKVTRSHICISFDELQHEKPVLDPAVHAGVDLNPNYIGVSISSGRRFMYDLKKLTRKSGEAPSSKKSKHLVNKLKHETIQVAVDVFNELLRAKVGVLTLENLKFSQGDKGLGTEFNRLTTNAWKRGLFVLQLKKRAAVAGMKVIELHPAYTSFIGNLQYDYPDPISAAAEISRRGFETKGKKSTKFYPELIIKKNLSNQWKKEIGSEFLDAKDWRELYAVIKNAKLKYRVPIPLSGFQKFKSRSSKCFKFYV